MLMTAVIRSATFGAHVSLAYSAYVSLSDILLDSSRIVAGKIRGERFELVTTRDRTSPGFTCRPRRYCGPVSIV
jgi:hypothetical protein